MLEGQDVAQIQVRGNLKALSRQPDGRPIA
jgi:hypothetical protein